MGRAGTDRRASIGCHPRARLRTRCDSAGLLTLDEQRQSPEHYMVLLQPVS